MSYNVRQTSAARPVVAAILAFVLVCGLLAVVFVAEVDVEAETIRSGVHMTAEERADARILKKENDEAAQWAHRVKKTAHSMHSIAGVEARSRARLQKQNAAIVKAEKEAAKQRHKGNKEARHAMRSVAAKSAENEVTRAISGMTANVKMMATKAAKEAAKGIVGKSHSAMRIHAAAHRNTRASSKMELLSRDVDLLKAAVRKAQAQAAAARLAAARKAAHYKAIVNSKVLRAQRDFNILKKKLAEFRNSKNIEKRNAMKLRKLAALVVRLSRRLKRNRRHLTRTKKRIGRAHSRVVVKIKVHKKHLKNLIAYYKKVIKRLKAELFAVRHSKGINSAMSSRISAEAAIVAQQRQKVRDLEAEVKRLRRAVRATKRHVHTYQIKGKKRKQVLGVAHVAYMNLERAVAHLKAMAEDRAHVVVIKGKKGSNAANAKKMIHDVKSAVKKASAGAKAAVASAVAKEAAAAAAEEARKHNHGIGVNIPGLNTALDKAAHSLHGLGKKPRVGFHVGGLGGGPHPLKTSGKLLKSERHTETHVKVAIGKMKAASHATPAMELIEDLF